MRVVPLVLFVFLVAGCISGPIQLSTQDLVNDAEKIQAGAGIFAEDAEADAAAAGKALANELEQRAAELGIPVQEKGGKENVYFSTSDGVGIQGTFFIGDPGYTIILVHMLGRDRGDWDAFAPKLVEEGYEVLSIDLRGHGESTNIGNYKDFHVGEFQNMVNDVDAAVEFLGETKIAIIGASVGANIALNYASEDPNVVAVVLMSPGEEYKGVGTLDAMAAYGDRPVLIMASEGDGYSAISSEKLSNAALGEKMWKKYDGSRHGTEFLGDAEAEGFIFGWLKSHFKEE